MTRLIIFHLYLIVYCNIIIIAAWQQIQQIFCQKFRFRFHKHFLTIYHTLAQLTLTYSTLIILLYQVLSNICPHLPIMEYKIVKVVDCFNFKMALFQKKLCAIFWLNSFPKPYFLYTFQQITAQIYW